MKYFFSFFLSAFFSISLLAQPFISDKTRSTGNGNVYAIVVGISNYLEPGIQQLQFANRDAEVFADFLQSKGGGSVPKENIRLLTDSNATTVAVYNAIYWLKKTAKKDDIVFFYFSGHGGLENITMFNDAFLICYNSPQVNYVGMALSVEYLNKVANTLSAETDAKVILITDACHSGKITDAQYKANRLVGEKLMATNEKEIRIASCTFDQLSNEKVDWGGGRGVFSYYLVNGLKGLADKSNDAVVTVGEIKNYLENALKTDPVLKQEKIIQTPVFKGDDVFTLAKVDAEELKETQQLSVADSVTNAAVSFSSGNKEEDVLDISADDYFISLLKKQSLETLTAGLQLDKISADEIPFALINHVKDSLQNEAGVGMLNELLKNLKNNSGLLSHFNEMLMGVFDNKAQEVINQYLKGDEAELERRRYYNISSNGYDVYAKMLAVAVQLAEPASDYYKILQVKLHYFTGVTLRLKLPLIENQAPLIEQALSEQLKALELEKHAAYIYNELGILYDLKKQYTEAEKNYNLAIAKNSQWAIPWANIGGLYASLGKYAQGIAACSVADSLQPGLQITAVNTGFGYEKSSNLLYAEEYYRKAIDINSRHYLPFENLGYVYMNTTQYALADSFFYEADLRKKGYHFSADNIRGGRDKEPISPTLGPSCSFADTLRADDMLGYFAMGISAFYNLGTGPVNADGVMTRFGKNNPLALQCFKKVISLDKKNPLVYHYLALIYYEQQQWEEAELMFRYAMDNYMPREAFDHYLDSVKRSTVYPYEHGCYEKTFEDRYYRRVEDLYLIASVYEKWDHPVEAELFYKKIIATNTGEMGGYIKCWQLLEKQALFTEAETVIKSYPAYNNDTIYRELNAFYRRAIEKNPDNSEWNYKLGLLLYNHASAPSKWLYIDTIVWFPKINREVFLGNSSLENWNSEDLSFDIGPGTSDVFIPEETSDMGIPKYLFIPGTEERIELAAAALYPRYEGIKYLKRSAELISEKETLASINYKIADIYVWAGSKKQALPYYETSLRFDPSNANTRLNIADMCTAIYKNRQAMEQLGYLYNKKQIDFLHRILFAKFNMYAGQFDSAKKILNEAEAINPYPLSEITDLRGRLYLLSDNPDKAINFYKTYLATKPLDANTCYSLARLYAGKKNNAEAYTWLQKAIGYGFNYMFILKNDPAMTGLSKTEKWNSLIKNIDEKIWSKRNPVQDESN